MKFTSLKKICLVLSLLTATVILSSCGATTSTETEIKYCYIINHGASHSNPEPYNIVLEVDGCSLDENAIIKGYKYHCGDNQLWQIIKVDNTYFKIKNKLSGKFLQVDEDITKLTPIQKTENNTFHQQWYRQTSHDGFFYLINRQNKTVLESFPITGTSITTTIQQKPINTNTSTETFKNQLYKFITESEE